MKTNKSFLGTTRYASIAAHKGIELSRKDDLESLGYVIIYFLLGQLPWQTINLLINENKNTIIGNIKENIELSNLCKDLPL